MITIILSSILFFIFILLASFHFYWLFGGIWGLDKVIPSKNIDANIISIPKFVTFLVALILVFFAVMYLIKFYPIHFSFPSLVIKSAYWFIPSIFMLRAIGDFKYAGFFKKIKNTKFSKADTKIFSPLCLIISILGLILLY